MDETVDRISADYSGQLARVLGDFGRVGDEISSDATLSQGEREERILAAHDKYAEQYEETINQRNARYAERESEVLQELYGAPTGSASGAAFTTSLLQARAADDDGLGELANLAAKTGDENLGRAVVAVASQRGELALALPYINANEETLGLFRELSSIPDAEQRERSSQSRLPVPNLESLRPSPQAAMDAERAEVVERARRRSRLGMGH
jgi:hypothetical protein